MFTGIVEEVGMVESSRTAPDGNRISIRASKILDGVAIGDSIAVNGVCLTVAGLKGRTVFEADVMPETMRNTNLAELSSGSPVNLERAMPADGRLGGHLVSGHVDGTATLLSRKHEGNAVVMCFAVPPDLTAYIIKKGSVAVDGTSLTVADVTEKDFSVSLVPHTLAATTLGLKQIGDRFNLEVDVVGKYVEKHLHRLIENKTLATGKGLTLDYLMEQGF
ncbi:MAG: riboflavin synthase [Firmicutes bacterium]|jgi:riboflavin synthase|nr:riboflavin synthase [Bacillota bacterium]